MRTRVALGLYRCLLAFYPKGIRTEFGAEMRAVFAQALGEECASTGQLLWRELRDWPGALWQTHRAERRKIMIPAGTSRPQPALAHPADPVGAWRAAWLAALAYLLYLWLAAAEVILDASIGSLHLTSKMQSRIVGYGAGAILVVDLIVILLCWRRGWPRWSLPYLGVVLTWLVFVFQSLIKNDGSLLIYTSPLVALTVIGLAALGSWWKGLHTLSECLHRDWTLFGLAYLGYAPWVFFFLLDETRHQTIGTLLSSAILALGVLVYMRCSSLGWRVSVLPIAYATASLVAMFYLRVDYFYWPPYYTSDPWRSLVYWDVVGIAPLLVFGVLELGRHAFSRWLPAA